jgi:hypothetical protein
MQGCAEGSKTGTRVSEGAGDGANSFAKWEIVGKEWVVLVPSSHPK